MRTFKLLPINGAKSLNNQHVNTYTSEHEEWSDLISYTKRVASYNHTENYISIYNAQSNTTIKHINAFLSFYGFNTMSKKEILAQINN